MAMVRTERQACEAGDDFTDAGFSRAVFRGVLVGAPVAYLVIFGLALAALGPGAAATAAAIAVWPAFLGGAFYGGLALMVPVAAACAPRRREAAAPPAEVRRAA
jgi:hypothetical protein